VRLSNKELRKEAVMPTYILLSTLTPEGSKTLHQHPNRLEEVNKEEAALQCSRDYTG